MSLLMVWLFAIYIYPSLTSPLLTNIALSSHFNHKPYAANNSLTLGASGTFTLAIFSDLHYGENEDSFGPAQDVASAKVIRSVLDSEPNIDLVVLNGDLITGENTFRENASSYVDVVVAPLVERQQVWASTYGNHDSKFNLSREDVFLAEVKYPWSFTQRMTDPKSVPGITNYYLPIYESLGNKPAAILWFFDSRGGASYQHDPANVDDIPDWVANETVAWYRETRAALKEEFGPLPSIAFVHIPPHPFLTAQDAKLDSAHFPGVNDDVPVAIQGAGHDDDEFVKAMVEDDLLHSVYVGHDHGNAWCALFTSAQGKKRMEGRGSVEEDGQGSFDDEMAVESKGPFLCFDKHSGYGGYGNWNRGSRVVELKFDEKNGMEVNTWVRMESGDVVTAVSLNSTYGEDVYPTADGGISGS